MSITHSWNGTVLTITSDSGTSSADLKGDTGCRGPQGPAGILYNEDGSVVLEGYATEQYVDEQIVNVATGGTINLDNYYTKTEVDNKIANVPSGGGSSVNIDGTTIIKNADGTISTAIGGYAERYGWLCHLTNLGFTSSNPYVFAMDEPMTIGETYYYEIIIAGVVVPGTFVCSAPTDVSGWFYHTVNLPGVLEDSKVTIGGNISVAQGSVSSTASPFESFSLCKGTGPAEIEYYPIDGHFIPVDGTSIKLNSDGKLTATGVSGGTVDLSDYYTKSEVDAKIANSGGSGSGDLSNYYTKSEIDSKIGSVPAIEDEEGNVLTTTVVDYINYNASEANTYVEQLRQEIYDSDYATMEYVNNLALGGGDGSGIDLSNYVERTELDEYKQEVSNSIDAVYEQMDEKILYSTTDLTAGTSSLATGVLYVVYE